MFNKKNKQMKLITTTFLITILMLIFMSTSSFAAALFDEMDDINTWAAVNNCSLSRDTIIKKSGTSSIKMSAVNSGKDMEMKTSTTFIRDLSSIKNVEINLYIPDIKQINTISLFLMTSDTNFYYNYIGAWELKKGWNTIRRPINDFSAFGSPDWKNITKLSIKVEQNSISTTPSVINIDAISFDVTGHTEILFTFDDAWRGVYEEAFPYMSNKSMMGTTWVNKKFVTENDPNTMTIQQLNNIYSSGWDIGNHTVSHPDTIADLSREKRIEEYKTNKDWIEQEDSSIDKLAWTRAANHVCYPMGLYDDSLLSLMQELGFKTARTTIHGIQPSPVEDLYQLKCVAVGRDTELAFINKTVDDAVATGSDIFFMFHNIANAPNTSDPEQAIFASTKNFKQIVNKVAGLRDSKTLSVETISSWYNKYISENANIPAPGNTTNSRTSSTNSTANSISDIKTAPSPNAITISSGSAKVKTSMRNSKSYSKYASKSRQLLKSNKLSNNTNNYQSSIKKNCVKLSTR